jgi:hypothetical protein
MSRRTPGRRTQGAEHLGSRTVTPDRRQREPEDFQPKARLPGRQPSNRRFDPFQSGLVQSGGEPLCAIGNESHRIGVDRAWRRHFSYHLRHVRAAGSRLQDGLRNAQAILKALRLRVTPEPVIGPRVARTRWATSRVEERRGDLGMRHRSVSAPRSSNRTCGFPASGSPNDFTRRHAACRHVSGRA